jgi:hypothetical protein
MSSNAITRVQYFRGQFLRAQEFTQEQAYHVASRRRHNIAHHVWGILAGLDVTLEEDSLYVLPGLAIDGFGRELLITTKTKLADTAFDDRGSEELEVWLAYDRLSSDPPPRGYAGCGDPTGQLFYRWQETPRIRLERPDAEFTNRRTPKTVAAADLAFNPTLTASDDPERSWPVYLGSITRNAADSPQRYSVSLAGRPYAGLVGESLTAPSGGASLQIGSERAADDNRFAVFVPARSSSDEEGPPPPFAVREDGTISMRGDTTLSGHLRIRGGSVRFELGATRRAQPWRIYRHQAVDSAAEELRIEMLGGTDGANRVVVGAFSAQEKQFKPCLTIADDNSVTVHGNLIVQGTLSARELVPGRLSPEATAFVAGSLMSGVTGSSAILPRLFKRTSVVAASRAQPTNVQPPSIVRSFVQSLSETANLDEFTKALDELPELKTRVLDRLQEG